MNRRHFNSLVALGLMAAPMAGTAQTAGRMYRIGMLSSSRPNTMPIAILNKKWPWMNELHKLGWKGGENFIYERRFTDGKDELLPKLARELVDAKVDVIATFSVKDTRAVMGATTSIPIVMVYDGIDPVQEGIIKSFARPGGNVTGMSRMLTATDAKRLELLRDIHPAAKRVAVLANAQRDLASRKIFEQRLRAAATSLGIELQFLIYRTLEDVYAAFQTMTASGIQAFVLDPHYFTFHNRAKIAELAIKHRLPGAFTLGQYVQAGGLMSYGPNWWELERQHARIVDQVLRGANPAELAVGQPTKFELMVNQDTADALGITMPPSLVLRADKLIRKSKGDD